MSGTDIKCIKVGHTYPNGVQAIKDVDVTIKQGEIVSVVGQNGSGKTTLVKHFNGLLSRWQSDRPRHARSRTGPWNSGQISRPVIG
mgnify:CR=1 FL=1